jgi:Fur family zinc uptake transcriptional regulator
MNLAPLHSSPMSACTHDHAHPTVDVAAALAHAEALCGALGHRWTEPRRRVLELLVESGEPVKAYDLMAAYGEEGAKPATVYRALEFLEKVGLVHRIVSLSAFQACIGHDGAHGAAFLICDCCGSAEEFEAAAGDQVSQAARAHGFGVERVMVEVHGRCKACAA